MTNQTTAFLLTFYKYAHENEGVNAVVSCQSVETVHMEILKFPYKAKG